MYHKLGRNLTVSTHTYLLDERVEEGDGLNRLTQPHLVSQDGVGLLGPGEPKPVETFKLVGMEGATCLADVAWLLLVLQRRLKEGEGERER